ncbi:hypothetical protein HYH03_003612 [Edaphochlamys debaryana]|uniref:SAP domain-containing protein n=1 Tax=Edaphochlamys debaryana TaxID=47281 RepID=A0A835YBS4_9CHLO|nr:hypothetical protein HYH03_003612 [Edaphochlamys debaryana]|eukprot:KAG2498353.1 hypothetical protein HYH03_003612 [Edaphochlamys debaryana]
MSAAGSSGDGDGQSPSAPRARYVPWETLGVDLTLHIARVFTDELSPFYDEADLAKVAASCAQVGNATFKGIAESIFTVLSPHFGEELSVTKNSTAADLKKVLKSWGRPQSGKKAELWERICDEVKANPGDADESEDDEEEGDSEDEDDEVEACGGKGGEGGKGKGAGYRCPVARGVRQRIRELRYARITKAKAKEVYGLWPSICASLPTQRSLVRSIGGMGLTDTYAVADIKAAAIKQHKTYAGFQASQKRRQDWSANYDATKTDRTDRCKAVLAARGVSEEDATRALQHVWHAPFLTDWQSNTQLSGPEREAYLGAGALEVANMAHRWLFQSAHTPLVPHLNALCDFHTYGKSSKYKQTVALERRALDLALREWAHGQGSLEAALSHPSLPACLKAEVEAAWTKERAERPKRLEQIAALEERRRGVQQPHPQRLIDGPPPPDVPRLLTELKQVCFQLAGLGAKPECSWPGVANVDEAFLAFDADH